MTHAIWKNKKGVVLITSMIFIAVIAIFATVLFAQTIYERRQIEFQTNRIVAFQLAESGVDEAYAQLVNNPNYSGTGTVVNLGDGQYTTSVTTPDLVNNPNIRAITSIGYAPNNQTASYAYQEKTVTTYVQVNAQSPFNHAIFSDGKVKFKDEAKSDSYRSSAGPYGGANVGQKGNVASNTTRADSMEFRDQSRVRGDAICGPEGNPRQVITQERAHENIQGRIYANSNEQNNPRATLPGNLQSSGELELGGSQERRLRSGVYWFEEMKISGNGKLKLDGPTVIYVTGEVTITGNGVATSQSLPKNLIVLVVGNQDVQIKGQGALYGVVYAPQSSNVKLTGHAELFGSMVAKEFRADAHSKIHYDEDLKNLDHPNVPKATPATVNVVSWQEA